jgi:hypothetical protein
MECTDYSEIAESGWRGETSGLEPEIPALPVPAIEAVREFCLLERATRHGRHNAVQAFSGAHPQKYLLVPGSWLPSQMIWPPEKTCSSEPANNGRR